MAGEGRWTFEQIHLAGADSLSLRYAYPAPDGRLTPQYPFSYGLLAGPFYAAFGVRGLFLMNALAGAVGIILVHRIATAMRLGGRAAALSAVLFGAASIAATYYFAIWPHMATTALALAALLAAISAEADGASVAARLRRGAMAGALIGAAMTARVDTVLAVIAILVWQRAFIGGARAPTVGFLAGLAPVLIAAAAVNHQKFGVFNPLTYQSENGGGSIAAFAVPLAAAGGALAVLMVVDAQGVRARLVRFAQSAPRAFAATAASIAAAALFIFSDQAARLAHGALLLIVDMRAGNYAGIHGVTHNAWGMPLFFDLNKRALLQSMPFAPLALVGLARFLRGRGARGEGLLWLVAGAFITFYALSKWHGGMSLNMRYYLPAAAALSILCAASLARFSAFACDVDRRTAIRGFTAFIAVF